MAAPPSRLSSPFAHRTRSGSRSILNSPLGPPATQPPPAPPPGQTPSISPQYRFPEPHSAMGMVHMTAYAPGMASVPATTSSGHSPTAAYQYVASVVNAASSGTGTQLGHQTEIALNTQGGTIVVPVDTRTGSKNSDVHRKKNAQASKRHRQRKKEDFQSLKAMVQEQEHTIHELKEKNRELKDELERLRAWAEQNHINLPPSMATLPPIATIARDISRGSVTPGLRMDESRSDYFGSAASSMREPLPATTPLPGIENFDLGPLPSNSRAPSLAPKSRVQTPTPRISPELVDRVRGGLQHPPPSHPPPPPPVQWPHFS